MATLWVEYGYSMGRVWLHLAKSLPTPWELLVKRESKIVNLKQSRAGKTPTETGRTKADL